jgi:hypothetical protein
LNILFKNTVQSVILKGFFGVVGTVGFPGCFMASELRQNCAAMVPLRRGGVWLTSPLSGGALRGWVVAEAEQNQLPVASFQTDSHSKGIFVV